MTLPRPRSELQNPGRPDGRTTEKPVQKRLIDVKKSAIEYFWDGGCMYLVLKVSLKTQAGRTAGRHKNQSKKD